MATDIRGPHFLVAPPEAKSAYYHAAVGAAIAGAAVVLRAVTSSTPLHVVAAVLGILGMIIAGSSIIRRPKDSVVLGIAAGACLLAALATRSEWDAIRIMMWVMMGVAGAVAVLLLLPRTVQRALISLFVLYHFCGVLSAITSPHPMPWLTSQLWSRVFRPHLEFCYVNNAYQFYSPQPGPASILWFCITWEDEQSDWEIMPRRNERLDPLGVEYFRRLSLTERANMREPTPFGPPPELFRPRDEYSGVIPWHPIMARQFQFRMLNEHGRQIIASYARHVAKHNARPGVAVRSVKVYLTEHRMLNQSEFARGMDPYDPTTYIPYFVGEFTINESDGRAVLANANDAMLYWVVPIIAGPNHKSGPPGSPGLDIRNYVTIHAGSDPFAKQ